MKKKISYIKIIILKSKAKTVEELSNLEQDYFYVMVNVYTTLIRDI